MEYAFDLAGQLVTAGNATDNAQYVNDAFGRRIQEIAGSDTTTFVWYGGQIVSHGSAPAGYTLELYGPMNDHIFSVKVAGSGFDVASAFDYMTAPDGSVIAAHNGLTAVIESYGYSAFGEVSYFNPDGTPKSGSSIGNRFLFQGQLLDVTGTYSMRFREYDPRLGQFISRDPIGLAGGNNQFGFVESAPLTHSDPLGLLPTLRHYYGELNPGTQFVGGIWGVDGGYVWNAPGPGIDPSTADLGGGANATRPATPPSMLGLLSEAFQLTIGVSPEIARSLGGFQEMLTGYASGDVDGSPAAFDVWAAEYQSNPNNRGGSKTIAEDKVVRSPQRIGTSTMMRGRTRGSRRPAKFSMPAGSAIPVAGGGLCPVPFSAASTMTIAAQL